jgi:hypothetical protein
MALRSSYVLVLSAIKGAPHAVQTDRLVATTGLATNVLSTILADLEFNGYIKADTNGNGWFTRKPKRDEVNYFLATETSTLDGITFDEAQEVPIGAVPPVINPLPANLPAAFNPTGYETYNGIADDAFRKVLAAIKAAPHALHLSNMPLQTSEEGDILDVLIDLELIKEHRDVSDAYFTRKPMRAKIDAFLAGGSLSDLLETETEFVETVPRASNPEPLDSPVAPDVTSDTPDAPKGRDVKELTHGMAISGLFGSEVCNTEEYLNLLTTFRDLADAFLAQNGR